MVPPRHRPLYLQRLCRYVPISCIAPGYVSWSSRLVTPPVVSSGPPLGPVCPTSLSLCCCPGWVSRHHPPRRTSPCRTSNTGQSRVVRCDGGSPSSIPSTLAWNSTMWRWDQPGRTQKLINSPSRHKAARRGRQEKERTRRQRADQGRAEQGYS